MYLLQLQKKYNNFYNDYNTSDYIGERILKTIYNNFYDYLEILLVL